TVTGERGVGGAVLAVTSLRDRAAECLRHDLESVANAERGNLQAEDRGVEVGRTLGVHRARTTRENDRDGVLRGHLLRGNAVRHELAEHTGFAHATRDQLGVLCAEVYDENRALCRIGAHWAASWRGSLGEGLSDAARFAAARSSRPAR